jgi:hypothetical protein
MKTEDCVRGCAEGHEHYGPCSTGGAPTAPLASKQIAWLRDIVRRLESSTYQDRVVLQLPQAKALLAEIDALAVPETSASPRYKVGDSVGVPRRHDSPLAAEVEAVFTKFAYRVREGDGQEHYLDEPYVVELPAPKTSRGSLQPIDKPPQ